MKFLLPIINILIAGGLFFVVTDQILVNAPLKEDTSDITKSTGGIRALLARQTELDASIATAKVLAKRVNELNGIYNSFSAEDQAKLDQLLPDHVDNIQLIIDVNGIAKEHGMIIKNIKVTADADSDEKSSKNAVASDDEKGSSLGNMLLSFNVTGTYDAYKSFLADLATSLRVIDISSTSFNTDDKGIYTYNVELETYWLK